MDDVVDPSVCPFEVRRPVMEHRWDELTFLHWTYPVETVQRLLPPSLTVDAYEGLAYVGLVPFFMTVSLPGRGALPGVGRFCETNVRTYVRDESGRPGIWFFSLDATGLAAVLTARLTYRLPYCWSSMSLERRGDVIRYDCRRRWPGPARSHVAVQVGPPYEPTELGVRDHFLTARWILFSRTRRFHRLGRAAHAPWRLQRATVLEVDDGLVAAAGLPQPEGVPLAHVPRTPRVKPDRLPHEVRILAVVAACVALGFGIVAPAIPVFAKSFGVSNFAASSVISVFALMRFVSAFAGGRLVDRFGERLVLGTGIGIVGVSSAMAGFSHSFVQLLVLRGVGGAGSALFSVSSTSLLLRVVRAEQRGRASGTVQAGFLIGGIAGPAVGGPLSEWSLRAPFFVYAGTLAVAGSVAVIALAKSQLSAKSALTPGEHPMTLAQALRFPAYRAALTNGFANGWALFGVRSALVPLFVVEGLQVDRRWTGIGLLFWALVEGLALRPAGRASDTRGRRPLLLGGGAALMLSAVILSLAGAIPAYLAGMAIYGSGSAMLGVSSAAVVGDVIRGRGGRPVAAYQMSMDAGTFLGPLVCGALSDAFDFRVAFLVTAAVSAVAFTASLRMPETRVVTDVVGPSAGPHRAVTPDTGLAPERPVDPGPVAAD